MPRTTRECGAEKVAPEPPMAAACTSKSAGEDSPINSPTNTHANSLRRQQRVDKHKGAEKPVRTRVDKVLTAGVGKTYCTTSISSTHRERFSARASNATAATIPASSSTTGSIERRASTSNATVATTRASSSRARSIERRRASASNTTVSTHASISRGGFSESFDDSRYWDYASRFTQRQDIGNKCRECKRPFLVLKDEIVVRRGGRIELRYHKECFSMIADPRSQPSSSANVGKFVQSLKGTAAPEELYRKMRTRGHW